MTGNADNLITTTYREAFEKARTLGLDHDESHAYAEQVQQVTRQHLHDALNQYEALARMHRWDDPEP